MPKTDKKQEENCFLMAECKLSVSDQLPLMCQATENQKNT